MLEVVNIISINESSREKYKGEDLKGIFKVYLIFNWMLKVRDRKFKMMFRFVLDERM